MLRMISLSIVLGLASFGCSKKDAGGEAVAKVNGSKIALSALEKKMARISQIPGKDFSNNKMKRDLVDEMVNEELLFQAGMKDGIAENSERLRREIAREFLTKKIGSERYEPTDDEIKAMYEKKKNDLDQVRASHILFKTEKPGDPASEAAAKKKADAMLSRIKAQGAKADFEKLARENSQDEGTKSRGGDLQFFSRDKMVPEFSEAAFSLAKVGDLSGVVKTQYGYHIIKLTGERRGLDFFRQSLKWQIAQEKQKEKAEKLFADLRQKASVKIYDDALSKAKPPVGNPGGDPHGMMGMPMGHPPIPPPNPASK